MMPPESPLTIPAEQRKRLLLFNLRTDADDHILGFTTRWLNALAPYYEHVDVLTTHKGRLNVADNVAVYSVGREVGAGRVRRVLKFYGVLGRLLASHRYDACFAHMQPLFAVLAAPLLKLRRVPITTWYTHRQLTRTITLAERVSFRVVSAVESSFPLHTPKLRALGHGIDTDFYKPAPQAYTGRARVLQVARLTQIKHQHILLEAARDLDCEIVFVGDIPDGYEDAYKQRLMRQVADFGMAERVTFAGAQTPQQVRDWHHRATVAVNLSPAGLFDKAALEGMALGLPTIVSNPAFAPLMGTYDAHLHISAPDDVAALRERLQALCNMSATDRTAIGVHLRYGVVAHHSLHELVRKLITVMHTGELPAVIC